MAARVQKIDDMLFEFHDHVWFKVLDSTWSCFVDESHQLPAGF